MHIVFGNNRLRKRFNSNKELSRAYGDRMARVIRKRMDQLNAAPNLALMTGPGLGRLHPLTGDLAGHYSLDLVHPQRLLIRPNHEPVPKDENGGVNLEAVTAIEVVGIKDTHG